VDLDQDFLVVYYLRTLEDFDCVIYVDEDQALVDHSCDLVNLDIDLMVDHENEQVEDQNIGLVVGHDIEEVEVHEIDLEEDHGIYQEMNREIDLVDRGIDQEEAHWENV